MPRASVVLVVAKDGSISDVVDAETRQSIPYDTADETPHQEGGPPERVVSALTGDVWSPKELACWHSFNDDVAAFVPLPHCTVERQLASGVAYVFPSDRVPAVDSSFPLELRYATGVSLVEIETHMSDTGLALTESFFTSPDFARSLAEARRELSSSGRGDPPGVIAREMHDFLHAYTSEDYPDDPLLRKFHPDPFSVWDPQLRDGDFLGVFKSTWDRTNKNVKAMAGHSDGQVHFYAAVGWTLPMEIVDQLMLVIKTNPKASTWKGLVSRKEFARAEKLSCDVRTRLLTKFLATVKLFPKESCRNVVHTTSDVFRHASLSPTDVGEEGDENETKDYVVFYSGCAPTHTAEGGVLAMSNSDPNKPIFWFHGPRKTGLIGGTAWHQPGSANAFPTLGGSLMCNRKLLEVMGRAGYKEGWGYAKLHPILFVS